MGHHYIPKWYLRGFVDSSLPDVLWQFDKKNHTFSEKPISIEKIAQERSFYDIDTERLLNELIEDPANTVLDKLRSGDLDLDLEERAKLSIYIATMLKRVPYHRAKGKALAPDVLKRVTTELRERVHAMVHTGKISSEAAQKRFAEMDAAETKLAKEISNNICAQIRDPWPSEMMINLVYCMHWRFICAQPENYFVTTDNPVFFFECYGLGTEDSELTFPVSNHLAILGSWAPANGHNKVVQKSQLVKEVNRRLISTATRFIYSRYRDDWIHKVAVKEQPYLSRIKWQ